MSNPTIPWQLLQLDPDSDAPRLMQDFESILDWLLTEAVHRHHMVATSVSVPTLAAGALSDQSVSFTPAFPTNVTPRVLLSVNTTVSTKPGQADKLGYFATNITNSGCDLRIANNGSTTLGAGVILVVVAFDDTYDTSL
jgi:hypothetical protein